MYKPRRTLCGVLINSLIPIVDIIFEVFRINGSLGEDPGCFTLLDMSFEYITLDICIYFDGDKQKKIESLATEPLEADTVTWKINEKDETTQRQSIVSRIAES